MTVGLAHGQDFTGLAYSYTALPTIQMLAMGGIRSYHIVCSVIMLTLLGTIAAPLAPTWIRNSINFGCYCFFTTVCNYLKEKADRRVFLLRYELKKQAKATQSAMAREDAEGASKKRVSFRAGEVVVAKAWTDPLLLRCPLSSSPSAHPALLVSSLERSLTRIYCLLVASSTRSAFRSTQLSWRSRTSRAQTSLSLRAQRSTTSR